jgi:hypothetical protein
MSPSVQDSVGDVYAHVTVEQAVGGLVAPVHTETVIVAPPKAPSASAVNFCTVPARSIRNLRSVEVLLAASCVPV